MLNLGPQSANPIPNAILAAAQEAADDVAALHASRASQQDMAEQLAQVQARAQKDIADAASQKTEADTAVAADATKVDAAREKLKQLVDQYFASTPPAPPAVQGRR